MSPHHFNPLDLPDAAFLARAQSICPTKAAYTTRSEAAAFLKRWGHTGTPYACPFCDHWHITTQNRKQCRDFVRRLSRLRREANHP